jgi:general secretion pathway protein H
MSRRSAHIAGFTLIEMVCVMAMLALIATILLPRIPHETTPARLHAYALQLASLLKQDRNAAIRRHTEVSTAIDAGARSVRSGATGQSLQLPADVVFSALLPDRCADRRAFSTINFFASGMSCGGVLALAREGNTIEIRVNWLTGGIELATGQPT